MRQPSNWFPAVRQHRIRSSASSGIRRTCRMKLTTRLALKLLPSYVWDSIRQEWALRRRSWGNRRSKAATVLSGTGLKLHLGCGPRAMPGWVNIDAFEQPNLNLRWDLRDPFPCRDGVAELIYSEHVLEHLDRGDADRLLVELRRLLQPGGIVRLGVPDAEIYFRHYVEGNGEFFAQLQHLGGAVQPLETPIEVINQMFRMGGAHLFAWDFPTLKLALERAGFMEISQWPSGRASRPDLCLDAPEHEFETLYLEAMRPIE